MRDCTQFVGRRSVLAGLASLPVVAWAHHGWSSFDQDRPWYLAGTVRQVRWANPHAELLVQVDGALALPADLAQRSYPPQAAPVDALGLAGRSRVPETPQGEWWVELAPLTRLQAWGLAAPPIGAPVEVLGFALRTPEARRTLRAEFLWVQGKVVGLRSSPA